MQRFISFVAAALFFAPPAAAESFSGRDGLSFSLARGSISTPRKADLVITARGVWAEQGIKRSSRTGDFATLEVSVVGEAYDLKDLAGGKWRMWIRTVAGNSVDVDLIRLRPPAPVTERAYQAMAVTLDGLPAEPSFSPLTLLADGSYRLGRIRGRYHVEESGVTLDGVPGQWGRAAFAANADGLVFRFFRGRIIYEVRYERRVDVSMTQRATERTSCAVTPGENPRQLADNAQAGTMQ